MWIQASPQARQELASRFYGYPRHCKHISNDSRVLRRADIKPRRIHQMNSTPLVYEGMGLYLCSAFEMFVSMTHWSLRIRHDAYMIQDYVLPRPHGLH